MLELIGKYNLAKIFNDYVEPLAQSQIIQLLNQSAFTDSCIRIMSDVHAGAGCVIGFTANLGDKVIPNIVGVDIGCGVIAINLGNIDLNLQKLDELIYTIPHGANVNNYDGNPLHINSKLHVKLSDEFIQQVIDISNKTDVNKLNRHFQSIGSLGSGNHYFEGCIDKSNDKWLCIHSGSRNFGLTVAKYHQKKAIEYCTQKRHMLKDEYNKYLGRMRKEDDKSKGLNNLYDQYKVPKELSFLEGDDFKEYYNDMQVAQQFADYNRKEMAYRILNLLEIDMNSIDSFTTIHNYINSKDGIIRKGAISAYKGERCIIPMNMRDGSLLCIGKGNFDWNYSAPHGAGRLMSRSKAKETLSYDEFESTMSDVYTTSVRQNTLDEAPEAYKSKEEIIKYIGDTVTIIDELIPIYNFKA